MTAREEVLARIRGALGGAPTAAEVPREYRRVGDHEPGSPALVDRLVDRLTDYRATVLRSDADDRAIGQAIADVLTPLGPLGVDRAITAPGVPGDWAARLSAAVVVDDGTLTPRELDRIPAVVTGSVLAIADTGTIALDGSPLCGRRATTLMPDTHVCVVRVEDVVETVPEGLARLDPRRPLTLISGPSATSDIELNRVEGVHGPRTLIVVIAG